MKEITNRTSSPIQLMVRSSLKPRSFTTQIVYGRGQNKNVIQIEDEDLTPQISLLERKKLITVKDI